MFNIKQFSSGEYDVKLSDRIYNSKVTIHWNWFDESQRDIFQLLLKVDAIKRTYGDIKIEINAPYLPYMRQDRVFEAGQGLPLDVLINVLKSAGVTKIITYAPHTNYKSDFIESIKLNADYEYIIVFPDINAKNHFKNIPAEFISFEKIRNETEITLKIIPIYNKGYINEKCYTYLSGAQCLYSPSIKYLICDDICAGGRTFIECANKLREEYGNDINIELLIYNAFLDYGLDNLKNSGISKIHIINKDSYDYISNLYPNDLDYFNFYGA